MRSFLVTLVCLVLMVYSAGAADEKMEADMNLTLAHALQANEMASIEVQLGLLAPGREIEVTTVAGRKLGVISPYGARPGQEAGIYTVPLPADVFVDGRVTLRLLVDQPGGRAPRVPTTDEVRSVHLKVAVADAR